MDRHVPDGQAPVILSRRQYEQIVEHAQEGAPEEVCGLLGGRDGRVQCLYRVENVDRRPAVRYNMTPERIWEVIQDIERQGMDLMGIYHSHPVSEARPSYTDVELAHYPDAAYLIITLRNPGQPVMRAFSIRQGIIAELSLVIEDS